MSEKFNKMRKEVQARAAIPQVDPEVPAEVTMPPKRAVLPVLDSESPDITAVPASLETRDKGVASAEEARGQYLTRVDTSEKPTNHGFHMYPTRHTQIARDLSYIEGRKPWEIIEDALEEYVIKHYGKDHRRE